MTELERKLYLACHHAFLWMCGNGTEAAEKETMRVLEEAMESYKEAESAPKEFVGWCECSKNFHYKVWNYCPHCGAARPKEKTLAEKFEDWGEFNSDMSDKEMFRSLAEIAELHFAELKTKKV